MLSQYHTFSLSPASWRQGHHGTGQTSGFPIAVETTGLRLSKRWQKTHAWVEVGPLVAIQPTRGVRRLWVNGAWACCPAPRVPPAGHVACLAWRHERDKAREA